MPEAVTLVTVKVYVPLALRTLLDVSVTLPEPSVVPVSESLVRPLHWPDTLAPETTDPASSRIVTVGANRLHDVKQAGLIKMPR